MSGRTPIILLAVLLLQGLLPGGTPAQDDVQPGRGVLLVAAAHITDPRFQESVILLLEAGPQGSVGLILNKPTATKVSSRIGGTGSLGRGDAALFFGGPVGGHDLMMLRRMEKASAEWVAVAAGVFVTKRRTAMMEALMVTQAEDEVRVFAGYAGWTIGQLEREIRRGDWYLLPADADLVFKRDVKKLWPELYRKSRETITDLPGASLRAS